MRNAMRPIPPGEILRGEMDELGLTASALARQLNVPPNRITGILNRKRAITADTALRLARYFGVSADFWINLEVAYELRLAEREHGAEIRRDVRPRAA